MKGYFYYNWLERKAFPEKIVKPLFALPIEVKRANPNAYYLIFYSVKKVCDDQLVVMFAERFWERDRYAVYLCVIDVSYFDQFCSIEDLYENLMVYNIWAEDSITGRHPFDSFKPALNALGEIEQMIQEEVNEEKQHLAVVVSASDIRRLNVYRKVLKKYGYQEEKVINNPPSDEDIILVKKIDPC